MLFYGKTDIGKRRNANEDNFIIRKYSDNVLVAIVCDGMGGVHGGGIASKIAADAFMSVVNSYEEKQKLFADMSEEDIIDMLSAASSSANSEVFKAGSADPSLSGMGTTLVACLLIDSIAYIVNVGDSRMYIAADGEIEQVTHDHSRVQHLVDTGEMTPEEAKHSIFRNQIYRAVGTYKTVDSDFFVCEMKHGTYAVLCSDGLTDHIDPPDILNAIMNTQHSGTLESACEEMIELANSRGGRDNITAVILAI